MRRAAAALGLLVALLLAPALGQDDRRVDPLAPGPPSEEALRRETGALLARLVRRQTTPSAGPGARAGVESLLTLEVEERGKLFGQTREVEVAVRQRNGGHDVRVRFRGPAELRDQAHLQLADGRAWRYDPTRRRAERAAALEPSWRVGGSGLLLRDLLVDAEGDAEDDVGDDVEHVLVRDDRVGERAVHVVRSRTREGGLVRLVFVDRELHVPLRRVEHDAAGDVTRTIEASEWRRVLGCLRPSTLRITEDHRTTLIRVGECRALTTDSRFDPARFFAD